MDWIADKEAPTSTRTTPVPVKIECPQCKSEIRLARPRSRVVEAVGVIEKQSRKLILPTIALGLTHIVLLSCSHHGAHTIRMLFGAEDADVILAPIATHGWFEWQALRVAPAIAQPLVRGWRGLRTELGLPLIPAALIASRTTMADAVLPILPILFFATQKDSRQIFSFSKGYWPPSAALTFIVLPYIRGLYDEYMERVWGERERGWIKEIQPRFAQTDDTGGNADEDVPDEDDNIMEIEIGIDLDEVGMMMEEEGEEEEDGNGDDEDDDFQQINDQDREELQAQEQQQQQQQAPPLNAPPLDAPRPAALGHEEIAQNLIDQLRAAPAPPLPLPAQPPVRREANLAISLTRMASTVLGALLFPSISAFVGEVLRLALPLSWTTPQRLGYYSRNSRVTATGLLQTRWGRSVVGGCLFVVCKDAVRVYCRWRLAQAFRTRRVLDWEGKGKAGRRGGA